MIKCIAHRGASAEAPENTLAAFRQALALKVHGLECDVHLSKDNKVVVIHDTHIGRTTTSTKKVHVTDLTFKELQRFDAGSWFAPQFKHERIPSLEELIEITPKEMPLMIEIKRGLSPPAKSAAAVVQVVNRYPDHTLLLGSLSISILQEVLALNPHLVLIGVVDKAEHLLPLLQLPLNRLAIWHKILDHSGMDILLKRNLKIWSYTVDDPARAHELSALGVEAIITNNPRILMSDRGS